MVTIVLCVATVSLAADNINSNSNHHDTNMGIALSWGMTQGTTVLWIMSCHASRTTSPTDQELALSCCQAMARATESSLHISSNNNTTGPMDSSFTIAACQEHGSLVPYNDNYSDESYSSAAATIRFLYQVPLNHQATWLTDNVTRQHYFLNDGLQEGYWWSPIARESALVNEKDPEASQPPDWLESLFGNHVQPNVSTSTTSQPSSVNFQSVLSQQGGMHRSLEHEVTIPLHPLRNPHHHHRVVSIHRLEISFLMLIPSDMFMDAEDAFDEHQWKVLIMAGGVSSLHPMTTTTTTTTVSGQYSLTVQSHKVMDVEQPAFNSPQHAVMIHLDWNATDSIKVAFHDDQDSLVVPPPSHSLVVRFATKVHLRYPAPTNNNNNSSSSKASSRHVPVVLVPPLWIQGNMAVSTKLAHENVPDEQVLVILQPPSQPSSSTRTHQEHMLGFFHPDALVRGADNTIAFLDQPMNHHHQQQVPLLTTTVAAGIVEDFEWVATLTVIFSIVGAILLGYETSRIVSSPHQAGS